MSSRLKLFWINQLFGEYSYEIPIRYNERITAIIGPNGVGKTVCLRLINAFFHGHSWVIANTVFDALGFQFTTGERVTITRLVPTSNVPSDTIPRDDDKPTSQLKYRLETPTGGDFSWEPVSIELTPGNIARIVRILPFLTRTGPSTWTHDHTGEDYSIARIAEEYSERFPDNFFTGTDEPEPLKVLLSSIDCHLIETQRLLVLESGVERSHFFVHGEEIRPRRRGRSNLAVLQKAQSLADILQKTLTDYAAVSQTLDRSFPRRVIEFQGPSTISESVLKAKFDELDEKRNALMTAGILDTESDPVSIQAGNIHGDLARVLEIYIKDTTQKLEVLDDLLSKLALFQELIRDRFIGKQILIDRRTGFRICARDGREIPLDRLSSGEQHQLILVFELLFELRENALILIDEPELSLHVTWQKKFISDLQRIIKLNNFDVILATHSPQLIGRWKDLTVELGEVDENAIEA
jgi:ABC-type phosphate transport system ATPase subunit